jgi:hypothetical protein
MAAPIAATAGAAGRTGGGAAGAADDVQDLLDASRQQGVVNVELLARELGPIALKDASRGAELLAEIRPQLSARDGEKLARDVAEEVDAGLARRTASDSPDAGGPAAAQREALALDLVQIGLSIAGIFDPTPVSDGLDGLISLLRGDFVGAGISAVSMIPYLGDAAKLAKLPRFAETVVRAADLAKVDADVARQAAPAFDAIRSALRSVPTESLPASARDAVRKMQGRIDELASAAARNVTRNGYDYALDAQGRVTKVEGTLKLDHANGRNPKAQREAGGPDRLPDDQGGHYIARIFDGPLDDFNHFAQNGNFNMGAYRSLERRWDQLLQDGHRVDVEIVPRYAGDSLRPDRLTVKYSIDGVPQDPIHFKNRPGGR